MVRVQVGAKISGVLSTKCPGLGGQIRSVRGKQSRSVERNGCGDGARATGGNGDGGVHVARRGLSAVGDASSASGVEW